MIKYSLRCDNDHDFDSWFQSCDAYDTLQQTNMLTCPICGTCIVEKNMMTPQLASSDKNELAKDEKVDFKAPSTKLELAIRELKKEIEKHSEYVGQTFANEARAIHTGDAPSRSIYGEAQAREARELLEEGINVFPLPWANTPNTH